MVGLDGGGMGARPRMVRLTVRSPSRAYRDRDFYRPPYSHDGAALDHAAQGNPKAETRPLRRRSRNVGDSWSDCRLSH